MTSTLLRERNQITIPDPVVQAAGLHPQKDFIEWRFGGGEIRGRKLVPAPGRDGKIVRDRKTGLVYIDSDVSEAEARAAVLDLNPIRE